MKTEENLSDKILWCAHCDNDLRSKDVKEFIRKLIADEFINSSGEAFKRIRKYAGDKLT